MQSQASKSLALCLPTSCMPVYRAASCLGCLLKVSEASGGPHKASRDPLGLQTPSRRNSQPDYNLRNLWEMLLIEFSTSFKGCNLVWHQSMARVSGFVFDTQDLTVTRVRSKCKSSSPNSNPDSFLPISATEIRHRSHKGHMSSLNTVCKTCNVVELVTRQNPKSGCLWNDHQLLLLSLTFTYHLLSFHSYFQYTCACTWVIRVCLFCCCTALSRSLSLPLSFLSATMGE